MERTMLSLGVGRATDDSPPRAPLISPPGGAHSAPAAHFA
jgi:hypothetical protein